MSSSRNAFSGLKPNTLPMIEDDKLAIEADSNRSKGSAMWAKYAPGDFGPGSTRYHLATYFSGAVSRSVHTTVQVAVEDSPATAAEASIGSTPSCGVTRNSAVMAVSFGVSS